jgi:hypothetical protein
MGSLTSEWSTDRLPDVPCAGILAYTAFMTPHVFPIAVSAYVRMHFQKSWEGTTHHQVRLGHVVGRGRCGPATTMATSYAAMVCLVLVAFGCFRFAPSPLAVVAHWRCRYCSLAALAFRIGCSSPRRCQNYGSRRSAILPGDHADPASPAARLPIRPTCQC